MGIAIAMQMIAEVAVRLLLSLATLLTRFRKSGAAAPLTGASSSSPKPAPSGLIVPESARAGIVNGAKEALKIDPKRMENPLVWLAGALFVLALIAILSRLEWVALLTAGGVVLCALFVGRHWKG